MIVTRCGGVIVRAIKPEVEAEMAAIEKSSCDIKHGPLRCWSSQNASNCQCQKLSRQLSCGILNLSRPKIAPLSLMFVNMDMAATQPVVLGEEQCLDLPTTGTRAVVRSRVLITRRTISGSAISNYQYVEGFSK